MRGFTPAPGPCPGPGCGSSWRGEQTISRCNVRNPAGFHPCTPQGALPLDPFCGSSRPDEQTISRCSWQHAKTRLQKPIVILRVGGDTATRTHGLGSFQPPAGCQRHPGKTIKRSGERIHSLNRSFFVFIAPVGTYFVPQVSCGNTFVLQACTSQDGCRGNPPAAG